MRPTASEVFAVKFQDVEIVDDPKRLQITLRRGKTGYRVVNSLEAAVSVYKRVMKRNHARTDYLFAPSLKQRQYVPEHFSKMFRVVLREAGLATDQQTANKHTLYSLRHTAICMRLVNSGGKVNLFSLAKNAGTSVDQIERFYARYLPLTGEMVRNLQSFAEG
jgi:integrase